MSALSDSGFSTNLSPGGFGQFPHDLDFRISAWFDSGFKNIRQSRRFWAVSTRFGFPYFCQFRGSTVDSSTYVSPGGFGRTPLVCETVLMDVRHDPVHGRASCDFRAWPHMRLC